MSTLFISLLSGVTGMFGWGVTDFFSGIFSKKIGPYRTVFWIQLIGLLALLPLIPLVTISIPLSLSMWLLLLLGALCFTGAYLSFFRGFEIGNISIVAAIMNIWTVFTMLFAYLFMGQRLSTLQLIGVILIVSGATLASINWKEIKNSRFKLSLGVKETVVGAVFFGIFWNFSEIISEEIGWLAATLYIKVGVIFFLLIIAVRFKKKILIQGATRKTTIILILIGALEAGTNAVVNYGLTIGDAILISPISSALSVVTITLAIVFLKERVTLFQGFGIVIAVLGIVLTGV